LWSQQQGALETIVIYSQLLHFAEKADIHWLYWRRDRYPLEMRRILISSIRGQRLHPEAKYYVELGNTQKVKWRKWPYPLKTILLDAKSDRS
jgi:hypothetical protein